MSMEHGIGIIEAREVHLEWSAAVRLNHWLTVAVILVLIVTGFYIADPITIPAGETTYKSFMADVTLWHASAGIALAMLFIWRFYLAFFSRFRRDWRDFVAWADWGCLVKEVRYYLLIDREGPEHAQCVFGPIQSLAYFFLWIGIIVIVATGFILMGANHQDWFSAAGYFIFKPLLKIMGNLATVRYVHHVMTWFFILFLIVHVYMAVWYDTVLRDGIMSSIIGGRRFKKIKTQ